MSDAQKYSYDFNVGDQIQIKDPETLKVFSATVIGADHYNETTAAPNLDDPNAGLTNAWISYTLTSDDAPEKWGKRFWAVDSQKAAESGEPRLKEFSKAFYVASQFPVKPKGVEFLDCMSGRVDLKVVGEALHSKTDEQNGDVVAEGILFTYRDPGNGKVWAEEVFRDENGQASRMTFDAKFDVEYEKFEP